MKKVLFLGLFFTFNLFALDNFISKEQVSKTNEKYLLIGEIPSCESKDIHKNKASESFLTITNSIKSIDLKTGNIETQELKEGYEKLYEVCKEKTGLYRLTISNTEYYLK